MRSSPTEFGAPAGREFGFNDTKYLWNRSKWKFIEEIKDKSDLPYDADSTVITNDVVWSDDNNNPIYAGYGGKISKIDGAWYWAGSQPLSFSRSQPFSAGVSLNASLPLRIRYVLLPHPSAFSYVSQS